MATNIQMRDFIALVTGGFMPLRDLIVAGQQIGLNASDAVEVITQLQPAMTPGNIMSNANMTSANPSAYVQPRIGFEEAVDFYNVPETRTIESTPAYYGQPMEEPSIGTGYFSPSGLPSETIMDTQIQPTISDTRIQPTNRTGSANMSMSDVINNNLRESMGQVDEMQAMQTRMPPPMPSPRPAPPPPPSYMSPVPVRQSFQAPPPPMEVTSRPAPITPVDFSYGNTQTAMTDAASTIRSPFTSDMDRQAAQSYLSGIMSNRIPF